MKIISILTPYDGAPSELINWTHLASHTPEVALIQIRSNLI